MVKKKLTLKQQKFADEFIANGGNATQAAILAGYSKKTAYQSGAENLKKPQVATYIKERRQAFSDAKVADQREVQEYLTRVMRGEETESVTTSKGVYGNVEVSAKDRLKAAEMLGRTMMMFTDKVQATVEDVTFVDDVPEGDEDG